MKRLTALTVCLMSSVPMAVMAQQAPQDQQSEQWQTQQTQQQQDTTPQEQGQGGNQYGPEVGDQEFSISGSGTNDRRFNNGSFSVVGDWGWYQWDNMVWGVRQSINYASIEGEGISDDFWNGSTRGYLNYQLLDQLVGQQLRPFVGASLGFIYGDAVNDGGFGGLELGVRYYVLEKTYILGRVDYQFFFSSGDSDDGFRNGAFNHTVGIGYHF
ncbi:MAG: hypothetical protein EA349_03410 [Halomonadaceae bacterium]|nr:MAG: hypothetical protein EA349_03410 [Halomonadaceae bacterium]